MSDQNTSRPPEAPDAPLKRLGKKKVLPGMARMAGAQAAQSPEEGEKDSPLKGLASVIVRNDFYRDGYRALRAVAALQAAIILVLILLFFIVINSTDKEYVYFATTEDGRLVPMLPLSEPNLSTPALTSWVAQAATETMTFGFHDYRKRLQEASRHFTRQGWASFTQALQTSGIIETVEANKQVVTAAPTSAPIIVSEGIVNGRYQWQVELPLNVTYRAGSQTRADNLLVRLVVVRVPKLESPNGVGIEQWIATAGGG